MSIPSGWYFVVESSEVPRGQVVRKEVFGTALALWRTASGALHATDAVCPHLGSDLGVLGAVKGEHLQCFSHAYTYDGEGNCVGTGFKAMPCRTERVLFRYPVHEVSGFVLVWYDAARRAPTFHIPNAIFDGTGKGRFVRSQFFFDVSVEILNEDNFDVGHLYKWHRVDEVRSSDAQVDGATISIVHDFTRHSIVFDKPLPGPLGALSDAITSRYGSTLYGHGLTYSFIDVFNIDYHFQDFIFVTPVSAGRTMYTTFVRQILPEGPRTPRQRFVDRVVHPLMLPLVVRRLRREHLHEGHGFWERQTKVDDPILTAQERRLIAPYRAWCAQFEPTAREDEHARRHLAVAS